MMVVYIHGVQMSQVSLVRVQITFGASTEGVPTEITLPTSIVTVDQIIARGDYSAIISDGKAYLWGANGNYQLGNNSDTNVLSVPNTSLNLDENIQAMALGYSHVVAITKSGIVYAWGNNDNGQLGIGKRHNVNLHLHYFL